MVGRQPNAPATFTPGEIPQRLSRPQGTWFGGTTEKIPVTPPGIDLWTVRLVAQHLNHYATPGPRHEIILVLKVYWKEKQGTLEAEKFVRFFPLQTFDLSCQGFKNFENRILLCACAILFQLVVSGCLTNYSLFFYIYKCNCHLK